MKNFLVPMIIGILITIIYFSIRTPNTFQKPPNINTGDYKFVNVTMSLIQHGKKLWTVNADESTIFKETSSCFLINADGTYKNNSSDLKKNILNFKSPIGVFNFDTGILSFVQTNADLSVNGHQYFIICDEISINTKDKLIFSYGNIQINTTNLILKGNKMIADLNKNKLYFSNDVQGTIIPHILN